MLYDPHDKIKLTKRNAYLTQRVDDGEPDDNPHVLDEQRRLMNGPAKGVAVRHRSDERRP